MNDFGRTDMSDSIPNRIGDRLSKVDSQPSPARPNYGRKNYMRSRLIASRARNDSSWRGQSIAAHHREDTTLSEFKLFPYQPSSYARGGTLHRAESGRYPEAWNYRSAIGTGLQSARLGGCGMPTVRPCTIWCCMDAVWIHRRCTRQHPFNQYTHPGGTD